MKTKEQLFEILQMLGICVQQYNHEPLFTVEQADPVYDALGISGGRCKNLFLKDSKKRLYLLVAKSDTPIALKVLGKAIGAPELRFADAQLLQEYLGVEPGSVTPFGLINDHEHRVMVVIDAAALRENSLNFHPLSNDVTVTIASADLIKFIEVCKNQYKVHDFSVL